MFMLVTLIDGGTKTVPIFVLPFMFSGVPRHGTLSLLNTFSFRRLCSRRFCSGQNSRVTVHRCFSDIICYAPGTIVYEQLFFRRNTIEEKSHLMRAEIIQLVLFVSTLIKVSWPRQILQLFKTHLGNCENLESHFDGAFCCHSA